MLSAIAVSTTMMTATLNANAAVMPDSGILSFTNEAAAARSTVTFYKDIVIHNEDTAVTKVYGPEIEYTYSIAPAAGNELATITDAAGNTVTAKAGIAAAIAMGADNKAAFTSSEVTLSEGKGVITNGVDITCDVTKFPGAGVYRYKVTEANSDTARTNASITRDTDNYSVDRYLDVYVKNGTSGLEIAGYVMFHLGKNQVAKIDGNTESEKITLEKKTTGFDSEDTTDESIGGTQSNQNMADHYYTFNYEVEKEITGALADKSHQFPFTVNTSKPTDSTAAVNFYVKKTEAGAHSSANDSLTATGEIGTAVSEGLADGSRLHLIGLPANASIASVIETNDTKDTYKSSAEKPAIAEASVAENGTFGFDTAKPLTNYAENKKTEPNDSALEVTKFTNNLNDTSQTGVILTYVPYAIMLGVALFFIGMFIRNKKNEENENTI